MGNGEQASLFHEPDPPAALQHVGGRAVVVREVRCKSLLNRSSIGDYSFNCYTGCAHGCVYCYARFMQRFHPHAEPWGGFVDVKVNADEVLARQLRRLKPGEVFSCSACDGWQPMERECGLGRRCCQMLLEAGFRLNILTKSKLVLRDISLFVERDVCLGVTITTSDEALARLWEPGASSVSDRWEILTQAKAAGLETAVMFGPLLPGISDTEPALARLFCGAAEAQVDRIWTDALNPRPRVWPSIQAFLRRLALPRSVKHWSFTTLREKLIKIGAKVVRHAKYVTFQMAEVAVPRDLFAAILDRIQRFGVPPPLV